MDKGNNMKIKRTFIIIGLILGSGLVGELLHGYFFEKGWEIAFQYDISDFRSIGRLLIFTLFIFIELSNLLVRKRPIDLKVELQEPSKFRAIIVCSIFAFVCILWGLAYKSPFSFMIGFCLTQMAILYGEYERFTSGFYEKKLVFSTSLIDYEDIESYRFDNNGLNLNYTERFVWLKETVEIVIPVPVEKQN